MNAAPCIPASNPKSRRAFAPVRPAASRHRNLSAWSLIVSLVLLCSHVFAAAPERRNVLLILSDDLNNLLGCYGGPGKSLS
jgi:hypothetical protein